MNVLVTGVNGFVGKHLARELKKRGDGIAGIGREANPAPEIKELIDSYWACDLMDINAVAKLPLEKIEAVINLAGLARVGDSFAEPEKYKAVNVGVLANLCQALVDKNLNPRTIAVSTSMVYDPHAPLPSTEDSELTQNGSPYATSKILMEEAASDFRTKGQDIVVVRPFNHIGPGQEEGFLVPDLYAKLRTAKTTGQAIKVGNLSTKRDYTDVRDVVKAYGDLAHAEGLKYDVYNVCSGKSVTGQEIFDRLLKLMGVIVKVESDPNLMRPSDNPDLFGSYQRLNQETGWKPVIPLQKTLSDFVASK
ncbi:MAG: NAD-dependent epimerase/dehydratase family protein [bacterium]|nr:NAD-dependent epimerase/dehydratase family protein [bacterium]